jgi:hypothetical protein
MRTKSFSQAARSKEFWMRRASRSVFACWMNLRVKSGSTATGLMASSGAAMP